MEITISEAIGLLSASAEGSTTHDEKFKASLKLGAEGLKLIRRERELHPRWVKLVLPGEAQEKP